MRTLSFGAWGRNTRSKQKVAGNECCACASGHFERCFTPQHQRASSLSLLNGALTKDLSRQPRKKSLIPPRKECRRCIKPLLALHLEATVHHPAVHNLLMNWDTECCFQPETYTALVVLARTSCRTHERRQQRISHADGPRRDAVAADELHVRRVMMFLRCNFIQSR